jgi:tRNA-dihydrouridine synthase
MQQKSLLLQLTRLTWHLIGCWLCCCRVQAGKIAADEGAAGLVLHARTADQQYSPPCHWNAVAQLVAAVPANVPVIGNGDIYEAADAIEMMRQTGCKGKM